MDGDHGGGMSQQTGLRARCGRLSVTEDVDNRPKLLVMTALTASPRQTKKVKTSVGGQDRCGRPRQVREKAKIMAKSDA